MSMHEFLDASSFSTSGFWNSNAFLLCPDCPLMSKGHQDTPPSTSRQSTTALNSVIKFVLVKLNANQITSVGEWSHYTWQNSYIACPRIPGFLQIRSLRSTIPSPKYTRSSLSLPHGTFASLLLLPLSYLTPRPTSSHRTIFSHLSYQHAVKRLQSRFVPTPVLPGLCPIYRLFRVRLIPISLPTSITSALPPQETHLDMTIVFAWPHKTTGLFSWLFVSQGASHREQVARASPNPQERRVLHQILRPIVIIDVPAGTMDFFQCKPSHLLAPSLQSSFRF